MIFQRAASTAFAPADLENLQQRLADREYEIGTLRSQLTGLRFDLAAAERRNDALLNGYEPADESARTIARQRRNLLALENRLAIVEGRPQIAPRGGAV